MSCNDPRVTIKRLRFQVKECQQALKAERNKGYAEGYNKARREMANAIRLVAGMEPL